MVDDVDDVDDVDVCVNPNGGNFFPVWGVNYPLVI